MNRAIRSTGMAILTVVLGACGVRDAGMERGVAGQPAPTGGVTLSVENHNWSDVVVYAVRSGMRYRLGTVTSMQRAELAVPPALTVADGDLRLLLDPIGSRNVFVTDPILVAPGDQVLFSVENHLPLSSWMVRR